MKNLKSYNKLFEMRMYEDELPEVQKYLSILELDKEDIKDKFIDLIDDGYKIYYVLRYKGSDGKFRKSKKTRNETPILEIHVTKNDSSFDGKRLKTPDFLQTVHDCVKGFYNMVSDKCKLEFEIIGGLNIDFECTFPVEINEKNIDIEIEELEKIAVKVMRECSPDDYLIDGSDEGFSSDIKLEMRPIDMTSKCKELADAYTEQTDSCVSNYSELEEIEKNILNKLDEELSKKIGKNVSHDKSTFYYLIDGVKFEFIRYSCYQDDIHLNKSKFKKKMGFFKKDLILEFEMYKIKLDLNIQ